MRHTRLVPILCFVMLASVSMGATAQSNGRFFAGWFAQGSERADGRGNGNNGGNNGARPAPPRPQPQEVRPQGDLRGDIYNHIREQRQAPPPPPPRERGGNRNRY